MAPELYRATRPLKLTLGNQVVEADEPDARLKLVDAGGFLTPAQAAEFGLTEDIAKDFGLEDARLNDAHPQAGSYTVVSAVGAPAVSRVALGRASAVPPPRRSGASAKEGAEESAAQPAPAAPTGALPSPTLGADGKLTGTMADQQTTGDTEGSAAAPVQKTAPTTAAAAAKPAAAKPAAHASTKGGSK
jgi:hypothetical protein